MNISVNDLAATIAALVCQKIGDAILPAADRARHGGTIVLPQMFREAAQIIRPDATLSATTDPVVAPDDEALLAASCLCDDRFCAPCEAVLARLRELGRLKTYWEQRAYGAEDDLDGMTKVRDALRAKLLSAPEPVWRVGILTMAAFCDDYMAWHQANVAPLSAEDSTPGAEGT